MFSIDNKLFGNLNSINCENVSSRVLRFCGECARHAGRTALAASCTG